MNQEWSDFLSQHGASADGLDFGNRIDEVGAAQTASIIAPLGNLGLIRVSGEDAVEFLHNLLTNDVEALPADGAARFGFCTPKGRLLATLLMWKDGHDLVMALPADLHVPILKKLSMYVLRSRVKLSDASNDYVLVGGAGPAAESALSSLGPPPANVMQVAGFDGGRMLRLGEQRFLLVIDHPVAAPAIWQRLAAQLRPVGIDAWQWLEITAGIPTVTAATQEEFIPQMINYELIGGVSFKKGCYPGQEIVARTQYLGKIKRRMFRAHVESGEPAPGMPVYAPETGDQACGTVVNVATSPLGGHDLLAVIQTSCADAGKLHLGQRNGPLLLLHPLPYPL